MDVREAGGDEKDRGEAEGPEGRALLRICEPLGLRRLYEIWGVGDCETR